MKRTNYMAFGSSLARLECKPCGETTLHRYGKCIHCNTEPERAAVSNVRPSWNGPYSRVVRR